MVLQLLIGTDYLNTFQPEQLNALAMLFLNTYGYGSLIWGLFFNLHLIVIAYLIISQGSFRKILGALFIFASLGYLIDSLGRFALPQYEAIYTLVVLTIIPAELSFSF